MPKQSTQTIPYNEQAVRKIANTPHGSQTAYTIKDVPGLMLTCFPSGTATFSVRYSVKGQRKKESIGPWGVVTLADARARALEVAAGAASNVDVLAVEAKEKSQLTLQQLWDKRLELETVRADRTMSDYGRALKADVLPKLGKRIASEITADDIADVLEEVEDRTKHGARHCRVALSSLYRWAQKRRLVRVNPVAGLGFNYSGKARRRVLTDTELRKLWHSIDNTPTVSGAMCHILKLAILTGQRNSEVAGMEVAELKGLGTAAPKWVIPAHRMKRKNEDQNVPLSKQAAEIARQVLTKAGGIHVFEGSTHGRVGGKWRQNFVANNTVSRSMGKVTKRAGLSDIHLHDMRKCVTSWLAEHGHATPEVLDAILHHGRKGVTGSHYNFALYEGQVRKALQIWADHVWQITGQADETASANNVVALAGRN